MISYRQGMNPVVYAVQHGGKGLTSTSDTNCVRLLYLGKHFFNCLFRKQGIHYRGKAHKSWQVLQACEIVWQCHVFLS